MGGRRISFGILALVTQSFPVPYFPALGLNTEIYRINLRI